MRKWTHQAREYIYRRVMGKFGPVKQWRLKTYPGKSKQEFDDFIKDISEELKLHFNIIVSPSAIRQQIDWGIHASQDIIRNNGHVGTWIMNRSVALEVGLIGYSDLPNLVVCHK